MSYIVKSIEKQKGIGCQSYKVVYRNIPDSKIVLARNKPIMYLKE